MSKDKIKSSKLKKAEQIVLNFGKYKNKTLRQIADFEPSYIVWLYETIALLKVSKALYKECLNKQYNFLNDEENLEGF